MSKLIVTFFLIISFVSAPVALASAPPSRDALMAQIKALTALLAQLRAERVAVSESSGKTVKAERLILPASIAPQGNFRGERVATRSAPRLDTFPSAGVTWFSRLGLTNRDVPRNSYLMLGFNTNQPTRILERLSLKHPTAYYDQNVSHLGINGEDFGAFIVGDMTVEKAGNYVISSNEHQAEARVIINGREVKKTTENTFVYLTPGTYRVEIEYVSNGFFTNFAVGIKPEAGYHSPTEIRNGISKMSEDFEVWYVGGYESGSRTLTTQLKLRNSSKPVILLLSGYSTTHWEIQNANSVMAVVYMSYEDATTVTADTAGIPVYRVNYDSLPLAYSIEVNCESYTGMIDACESIDQLTEIDNAALFITGKKISGFSGGYDPKTLTSPAKTITDSERARLLKSYKDARVADEKMRQNKGVGDVF